MMGFAHAGSGQWLDMDLKMMLARQFDHVAGACGPAIPEGDQGIGGQRHFPVADGTRAFTVACPIGWKAPDRDAAAGRPSLTQTVDSRRAAGNDFGDGPCQTSQGFRYEGFIRNLPGTGDDGSHNGHFCHDCIAYENTSCMRHRLSGQTTKICFNVGSRDVRAPFISRRWSRNHVK